MAKKVVFVNEETIKALGWEEQRAGKSHMILDDQQQAEYQRADRKRRQPQWDPESTDKPRGVRVTHRSATWIDMSHMSPEDFPRSQLRGRRAG